jgi:four helix bundle protein
MRFLLFFNILIEMMIQSFEELKIWQEAREVAKMVYEYTQSKEFEKDYKFRNQIRSASGSIMDNIAEGFERGGNREFLQFLSIAKGSVGETRSQCFRALDYGFLDSLQANKMFDKLTVLNMKIIKLMSYLKASNFKGPKFK